MGGTLWSDDHYADRAKHRAATGKAAFAYDADIRAGKTASKVHDKLNPHGVKWRESRDSAEHPESQAVAVLFDVTGSMGDVPRILQQNLPKLMGLLIRKGYLEHPHILVGGIGDATCDRAPLQIGQFEAGIEIENDLTNLFIEEGGGGQKTESYELAMYFMLNHTAMDCLEKRGKRGYLFIIGDEMPYKSVDPAEVVKIIGEKLQSPLSTVQVAKDLREKFDVFYILPKMTSYYYDPEVYGVWSKLFGQHALKLEDPAAICECIASAIGVAEGKTDAESIEDDLKEVGTDHRLAGVVRSALAKVAVGSRGTEISLPDSGDATGVATL